MIKSFIAVSMSAYVAMVPSVAAPKPALSSPIGLAQHIEDGGVQSFRRSYRYLHVLWRELRTGLGEVGSRCVIYVDMNRYANTESENGHLGWHEPEEKELERD